MILLDYNVQVFIKKNFEKWRPFLVREGVVADSPVFPWKSRDEVISGKYLAITLRNSPDKEPPYRYMFCKGNGFIAGLFYGNVYRTTKHGYCLFEPILSPSKSLYLPDYTKVTITQQPFLVLDSNFPQKNMLSLSKHINFKDCEEDIQSVLALIKRVMGSMPNITDQASKDVEMYVRAYHLQHKLFQMDRKRPVIWMRRFTPRRKYEKFGGIA